MPNYLHLILTTNAFKNQLTRIRSGSAKKRVQATSVLDKAIPLPSLGAQILLVAGYQQALDNAAELEAQALQIERDAQREFEAALGLTPPPDLPKRPFQVARFRDIERWSHEGVLQAALLGDAPPESKFEIVHSAIRHRILRTPEMPDQQTRQTRRDPISVLANVQRDYLDLREIKMINVPDEQMEVYRLKKDDVLFVEGNGSRKELGRVALWTGEIPDCVPSESHHQSPFGPDAHTRVYCRVVQHCGGTNAFSGTPRPPRGLGQSTQAKSRPHRSHCLRTRRHKLRSCGF